MTALEILKAGRQLIEVPHRWTQRVQARTAYSTAVRADDERAVCWCSYGAVEVIGKDFPEGQNRAIEALRATTDDGAFLEYQDTHTHAEVLAAWDRAIASLEAT